MYVDNLDKVNNNEIIVYRSTGLGSGGGAADLEFVDDILIKDGGTIGVASSASAITIASTGIVTLVDDLILKDLLLCLT